MPYALPRSHHPRLLQYYRLLKLSTLLAFTWGSFSIIETLISNMAQTVKSIFLPSFRWQLHYEVVRCLFCISLVGM